MKKKIGSFDFSPLFNESMTKKMLVDDPRIPVFNDIPEKGHK